jgi:ATP-dependent HslUV protease ATP-binding subunit HslU
MKKDVQEKAEKLAKKRILKILVGENAIDETKEKFSQMLDKGELNDREIEIEMLDSSSAMSTSFDIPGGQVGMINLSEMLGKAMGNEKTKKAQSQGIPIYTDKVFRERFL